MSDDVTQRSVSGLREVARTMRELGVIRATFYADGVLSEVTLGPAPVEATSEPDRKAPPLTVEEQRARRAAEVRALALNMPRGASPFPVTPVAKTAEGA